jgi:tannase/feruloyl esterase
MTLKGKAITEARYGRAPRLSYWTGCSQGGRQGLKEAQRFPDDYDAVLAGAPGNNFIALRACGIWVQQAINDPEGPLGSIPQCSSARTATAPTASRLARSRRRAGSMAARATPGPAKSSIPAPSPPARSVGAPTIPAPSPCTKNFWRDLHFNDKGWSLFALDFDRDVADARARNPELEAVDPDLSAFVARGGKLLLWHGWTDPISPPRNTVDYYRSVLARLGESVTESVRLFKAPGANHCRGGEGPSVIDELAVLEACGELRLCRAGVRRGESGPVAARRARCRARRPSGRC